MNITLRQLRGFITGARSSTFSAAAARLGVTQPGFSLLIRQLETELGLQLFSRTTRHVALTPAGEEFRARIERVMKDLDDIYRDMRDMADGQRGHVTLGVISSVAAGFLPEALQALSLTHPGISVTIREDDAVPLAEATLNSEVDFAVSALTNVQDLLSFAPIFDDQLIAVFSEGDPVLDAAALTWRLIANRPYIAIIRQSSVHRVVQEALHVAKVELEPVYEVRSVPTAIHLVKAGMGFTIMPDLSVDSVRLDGLVTRPIVDPAAFRRVGILTHRHRPHTPAGSAVAKALVKAASERQRQISKH
jgi:DNA-binding transcriptional LysR family regulator